MRLSKLYIEFFENEKASGITLVLVTALSLVLANSSWSNSYIGIWQQPLAGHDLAHWINDGLMALFFLLVGLELSRELKQGELSDIKNATLPILGAIGGMIAPAAIYTMLNYGTSSQSGAGIPMATDIAFTVGVLSLLGKKVPSSLKIFLTALAVIDDLGAIVVIAIFYTNNISWIYLGICALIFLGLIAMNKLKVNNLIPYIIGGILLWYFMLHSGIHATISGVLLAFTIPQSDKHNKKTLANKVQHALHKPVGFLIIPLFALANTAIELHNGWQSGLLQTSSIGIILGLVIGKPIGIVLLLRLGVATGICRLPNDVNWNQIIGAGMLAGIGFTMSIFITLLAFSQADVINYSKIAILIASLTSGIIGYIWLKTNLSKTNLSTIKQK